MIFEGVNGWVLRCNAWINPHTAILLRGPCRLDLNSRAHLDETCATCSGLKPHITGTGESRRRQATRSYSAPSISSGFTSKSSCYHRFSCSYTIHSERSVSRVFSPHHIYIWNATRTLPVLRGNQRQQLFEPVNKPGSDAHHGCPLRCKHQRVLPDSSSRRQ